MEDAVPMRLGHLGMDIIATIAQLGDFLGEQFDALRAVAEDDALIDVQLAEKRVEAVHLLPLLHKSVVLCDALQRQFLHEVNLVRITQMLLHELLDSERERGGEQKNLTFAWQARDNMIEHALKVGAEQLVSLIQHENTAVVHFGHLLVHEIKDATGRGDDHLHLLVDAHNVVA